MQEIWRDIKGYEGLYQVSNLGRIKSIPKKRMNGTNYYIQKEIILKQQLKNGKYYGVGLVKDKRWKNVLVHRIVAETFLPNPKNYKEVNHIDCNRLNNCVDNLEWCSQNQNIYHALMNGLLTKKKGQKQYDTTLFDFARFND